MTVSKNKVDRGEWFKEWFTPHESHSHRIRRYVVRRRTPFQEAVVADSHTFGRCLILDGEMQSAERDEFIYHESLVHPAAVTHPRPKKVLILGGGEGATARELLKHRSIERVTMVDIDGDVVAFCKKHLKSWHRGAFADRRVRLIIGDAKEFIETTDDKFDIILSDLPSPIEAGPAYLLYTIEFYETVAKKLAAGGVFVMQAGSGSVLQIELHRVLYSTLTRVFKIVRPFYAYVPSFDVPWAFLFASDRRDPLKVSTASADKAVSARIKGGLRFYDGAAHTGLFNVPKYIRDLLAAETRVIRANKPVFFYK